MSLKAIVSLIDSNGTYSQLAENLFNRECFHYYDSNNCDNEFCIYDNGIVLIKSCEDHQLELHLYDNAYAKVISDEGILRFDVKVLEFNKNDDIISIAYSINDDNKQIKIEYI